MIHVFDDDDCFNVWTDTEVGEKDGRCIGLHKHDRLRALLQAEKELKTDLAKVRKLISNTSPTD